MGDTLPAVEDRLRRIRDRHFDCFADLAEAARNGRGVDPSPQGLAPPAKPDGDEPDWFAVLTAELPNIRSALDWGLSTERPGTAGFAASLLWYWQRSRKLTEGSRVLERALRHPNLPLIARMDALAAAGALASDQGDAEAAEERFESVCRMAASVGDIRRQALAAIGRGFALMELARAASAIEAFTAALECADGLSLADRAAALRGLGWAHTLMGEPAVALELSREAREVLEQAADPALTSHYLAEINLLIPMGRLDEALGLADKALALARTGAGQIVFALEAKAKIADALGDRELIRRVIDEGVEATRASGARQWGAHFHGRLAEDAAIHGEVQAALDAVDRGLRLLDDLDALNATDVGVRAGLLAQQARLADDDGHFDLALELHRQVVSSHRRSPRSRAEALARLGGFYFDHGHPTEARELVTQAVGLIGDVDSDMIRYLGIQLAVVEDDLETALRLTMEGLDLVHPQRPRAVAILRAHQSDMLLELGRLDEAIAVADEALENAPESTKAPGHARPRLERARIRIAAGDAPGARADLRAIGSVLQVGWAGDQLSVATTLARLALLEGRGDAAGALWSAVHDYRTANRRVAPRLSRRFEEPLRELEVTGAASALDSRGALEALRSAVIEELAELARAG